MPEARLIDANALLKRLQEQQKYGSTIDSRGRAKAILEVIHAPTIEAEPARRGRWIAVSSFDACGGDEEVWMAHGNPTAYHYCSECKNETYVNEEGEEILSDYCPFCGADMREEGADNAGRK